MRNLLTFVFIFVVSGVVFGQHKQEYIYEFAEIAVDEMQTSGIPASITLAQGILESGSGRSELAAKSNNHFGIKCHKGWKGKSVKYDDDAKDECFRVYKDPAESYRDHSEFLTGRSRYASLFTLSKFDYKGWARGLKKAGYATSPTYAEKLIRIIEQERLYAFDYMKPKEVAPYVLALKRDNAPDVVRTADNSVRVSKAPEQNPTVKRSPELLNTADNARESMSRKVFYQNNIKTVWAQPGDSPEQLARIHGVSPRNLRKYNEWDKYLSQFQAGMKVYLQPKRSKSQDRASLFHTIQPGETMYAISQNYGVKTDKLYKLNRLPLGTQPAVGEVINLRKKRKSAPALEQINFKTASKGETAPPEKTKKKVRKVEPQPVISKPTPAPKPEPEPAPVKVVTPPPTVEIKEAPKTTKPPVTTPAPPAPSGQERAIIYEPTPEINKRPPEEYVPPEKAEPKLIYVYPEVVESSPPPTSAPSVPAARTHTVAKGDTLWALSQKYKVTVAQLKAWNNLPNNNIAVGQRLRVQP